MKITDLIEKLQEIAEFDRNLPVKLAYQPSWPMEMEVEEVVESEPDPYDPEDDEKVVYLVGSETNSYLPGHASEQIGWR